MATTGLSRNQMSTLELGPIAASVKRKATKKQWSRLVKQAHDRGFSVNSYLDQSTPNAMKERTRSSLTQQAQTTINTAYAPAEADITRREELTRSVDEKRRLDNDRFNQWLQGRHAELEANAKQASSAVLARHQALQAELQANAQQLQAGMNAYVNPTGQVSDPAQFSGTQDLAAAAAKDQSQMTNARELTSQMVGSNESQMAQTQANNIAFMAAQEAKRVADTWGKLSELGDERQKTQLSKAADAAKEISRLLDNETTKSQMRSDASIASAGLGLKEDQFALDLRQQRENERRNRADEGLRADQLAETQRANNIRFGQESERIKLGWYNARHRNNGGTGGRRTAANDPQTRFEEAYASLASSTRPTKDGKSTKQVDVSYVNKRVSDFENLLVSKYKLTRQMARAVMRAYLQKGGGDPGVYSQYTDNADAQRKR